LKKFNKPINEDVRKSLLVKIYNLVKENEFDLFYDLNIFLKDWNYFLLTNKIDRTSLESDKKISFINENVDNVLEILSDFIIDIEFRNDSGYIYVVLKNSLCCHINILKKYIYIANFLKYSESPYRKFDIFTDNVKNSELLKIYYFLENKAVK